MSNETPARSAPGRAAAMGLSAGAMIGAMYLGIRAAILIRTDCVPDATADDCLFQQTLNSEMANFFMIFAAGLVCVGVGIYFLFRRKP